MSAPAALSRGLQVLQYLAKAQTGVSFSEIAEVLETSNASTMRLLQSLVALGYVDKLTDNQGYRNTGKVDSLSGTQSLRSSFREASKCFLGSLVERSGNTAISIYWTGQFMVCLERIMHEDASPLQEPGHVVSTLHVAPWGWLFKSIDWWKQQNPKTINAKGYHLSKKEIIENLQMLDERGFTYLPGPERRRLAAPVYHDGRIIGALCLGGNIFTMPDDEIDHYGHILARSAEACTDLIN